MKAVHKEDTLSKGITLYKETNVIHDDTHHNQDLLSAEGAREKDTEPLYLPL